MTQPLVLHAPQIAGTADAAYVFAGTRGRTAWPTREGANLGAAGMWNFLWRLGYRPQQVESPPPPSSGRLLLAQLDAMPVPPLREALAGWCSAGGRLVVAGDAAACAAVVDPEGRWERARVPHFSSGLAYVRDGSRPLLMAPAGWAYTRIAAGHGAEAVGFGRVAAVGGERQSPERASVVPVEAAPAVLRTPRGCFLNASPFAAFQAWLQGQEDLQPWMAWRPRLSWLDAWVSDVAALLSALGALSLDADRPGLPGLGETTVVFRHDLDVSRDTAYLEDETRAAVAATHAVLPDRNARFWTSRLAAAPAHECAYHYTTGRTAWAQTAGRVLSGRRSRVLIADRSAVGRGLLRQVRAARASGIGIATLHRHLAFLLYPEWIDGMDATLAAEPTVLGSSSLFWGEVLRWGSDRVDGLTATVGEWPDAQFPLWLPFRLAHAADGGRLLRGWESTSLMEPEPALVDALLGSRLPHVPQRVFTFGFHPAHAAASTLVAGGSRDSFRAVLGVVRDHGASVRPLRDVYQLAHDAARH